MFLKREGPAQEAMPYVAIVVWYCFNLSVIFTNKRIFKHFPFPTGITMMHELLGFAFTSFLLSLDSSEEKTSQRKHPTSTRWDRMKAILPIAAAVTGNNYFSNMAIQSSGVAAAQTVKAIVPVFTLLIYKVFHGREYGLANYLAVGCVFGGVVLATCGDTTLTVAGVSAGVMASLCSAFKVVFANATTKKLNPLEASNLMAPYNIAMLAVVFYFTELTIMHQYTEELLTPTCVGLMLMHGLLVFGLQQAGIFSTAVNSPVIQTTAGNMKLVLVYIFAWLLHGEEMGISKQVGCVLTLVGGAWYGLLHQGFRTVSDVLTALRGHEAPLRKQGDDDAKKGH